MDAGKPIDLTARVAVTHSDGRKSMMHPNAARHLFYKGRLTYDNKKDETDDTHVSELVLSEAPDGGKKESKK